ncbi:PAS domain S-box protein [Gelidibacter gilvus]|uniref:histidine kinase n=1 Tax=Gelidibacter gilvus TaxID=59602 RepID=A0A4Q0XC98_9FLAO|nr:PAS domain S-box protein [Gelidibacter gilvus]RXJ44354.1 PAS domain S-box protein [Gelidibacter gilvus]
MNQKSKHIKILLLENDEGSLLSTSRWIKKRETDFEVLVLNSKSEYLKALDGYKPDIILFDHSFTFLDYEEALRLLKATKLEVPFILFSENISIDLGLKILKHGVSDYILKDNLKNLPFFIEKAINKNNLEQEHLQSYKKNTESVRKFEGLIKTSSDVIIILTPDGEINYISPSVEQLLGLSVQKVHHRKLVDLLNLDDPEIFIDAFTNSIGSVEKCTTSVLIQVKTKNKQSIWLQANFTNHLDDSSLNGIVLRLKNVTLERQNEIKILENEKKYRAFFENSLDGILLTNINGIIHAANPAACKIFQMTEDEICKKGRSGIVDLNDPRFHQAIKERELTGKTKSEINMFRKDGSSFVGELTSTIIDTNKGYASLVIKDNSEKKAFQHKLKKSEERYKSLFNNNPLPTFVFNENDLSIVDVNKSCSTNYGFTREEFLTMNLKDLQNQTENKHLDKLVEEFRNSPETSFHAYSTHLKKDKSEILVENSSHRFIIDGIPYVVAVCTDITEKERNLKKLTDTSIRLKVAEKIAKIGYWELDLNDNSLFCSDYIFNIYGIQDKNVKPTMDLFLKMMHPVDKKKYAKKLNELQLGIKGNEFEFRIILENGAVKWIHSRSKGVQKSEHQTHCIKGIIQDITSEKIAYEKLLKSESRYKGLVQSQTNYFVRIDIDGNYSFTNKKFIEEFGWAFKDHDPIGKSSLTDIMPYHHQKLRETAEHCISNPNENCQMEIDKRMEDGGVKTTLWDMIYLTDISEDGEIQGVGIDISERVKVERENKFQANLLNKIGQGIMATDSNDRVTYWNKAAEEIYLWKQDEVLGKNIFKLLYGNNEKHKDTLRLLKSGKIWTGELIAKLKDGSTLPTQITKSPLFDENETFLGVIRISSDISKLKKSEIKLKKLNKELSEYTKELFSANEGLEQFSYIVSHNLRAPIANILGIGDLLNNNIQPEDIHELLLHELFSNIGRLDDVMQDLHETLKLKTEFPKNLEKVKFESLIQNIIKSNKNLIDTEKVIIITDFTAIDEIYTVKSYLYSTFFNLISNSIKYRKPNVPPVIHISTEINKDEIIIHFKDNGLGINLEKKGDLIFGFYKRFHNHVEGKGLGLFMVKSQIEMLGGHITVKSLEGEGAEFIINLQK